MLVFDLTCEVGNSTKCWLNTERKTTVSKQISLKYSTCICQSLS